MYFAIGHDENSRCVLKKAAMLNMISLFQSIFTDMYLPIILVAYSLSIIYIDWTRILFPPSFTVQLQYVYFTTSLSINYLIITLFNVQCQFPTATQKDANSEYLVNTKVHLMNEQKKQKKLYFIIISTIKKEKTPRLDEAPYSKPLQFQCLGNAFSKAGWCSSKYNLNLDLIKVI